MLDPVHTAKRQLTLLTHRVRALPILILMPHSACNCRCVMCDIWKANAAKKEISGDDLERHIDSLRALDVRWVVLSGGEALMHSNLWELCRLLKELRVTITLLSTGLLLARHADDVVRWCDEVIVSLDGSREAHDAIRNVPHAFDRLAEGVRALRERDPRFRVTARCVLQQRNYADLPNAIAAARDIGLDRVSFLAADVTSDAFNRPVPWDADRVADVALSAEEVEEFARVVERTIEERAADFASGFVAESPEKLRRIPRYYAALNGDAELPEPRCNAPWVATVVEADGTVRPCFFHRPIGNVHDAPLADVLNSPDAVAFRRALDVRTDPVCARCVCSLQLRPWTKV